MEPQHPHVDVVVKLLEQARAKRADLRKKSEAIEKTLQQQQLQLQQQQQQQIAAAGPHSSVLTATIPTTTVQGAPPSREIRKKVLSIIFVQLKKLYAKNIPERVKADDARLLEQKIFAAHLYGKDEKLRAVIVHETQKYANARNRRMEEQNRIRRSIQRLLLFIHVKQCKESPCTDPEYKMMCPQYKDLFNHTMQCKNNDCTIHHCTSSKYIIAHWYKCADKRSCLTCGNVMETLRKQQRRQRSRGPRYTHDLMRVFSRTQFRKHFQAIRQECNVFYSTELLMAHFVPLLKKLEALEYGWIFATAVDAAAYDLAHYASVIKKPMDLSKIKDRLSKGRYSSQPPTDALYNDLRLVFTNAMQFNKPKHVAYKVAEEYLDVFETEFNEIAMQLSEEESKARMHPDNCALCGGGAIALEPLVLWCKDCGNKIQRKGNFYVSDLAANTQTCESCYRRCSDKELKATLSKRVHDQTPQEDWIACDCCNRWFHEICGLLNTSKVKKNQQAPAAAAAATQAAAQAAAAAAPKSGRGKAKSKAALKREAAAAAAAAKAAQAAVAAAAVANSKGPTISENHEVQYTCPLCIYQQRCQVGAEDPLTVDEYRGAGFLPENYMTAHMEKHIKNFLVENMRKRQREQGANYDPSQFARVKVRCVSNIERVISEATTKKNALLFEWLRQQNNYRMNFKGRSKMILLFQEHSGVDIVFFAMYVQEYDEATAHGPNKKTCYVSYLDSVKYFRPAELRTSLYYELLLSYFTWVKQRGFTRCYIWVCPPNEKNGDDYILYCHPKSQQTPTEDRLRLWYRKMVIEGHRRDIVVKCQTLTDAHLKDADDCTTLPYFSGDYWPQIAEIIIKELPKPPASTRKVLPLKKNGYGRKTGSQKKKPAAAATPKATGTRRGTRSTETELVGALANQKQRDALVKKLALKIGSNELRDNFMVIDFFDTCSHCRKFISKGDKQYSCRTCNDVIDSHWAEYTFKRGTMKGLPGKATGRGKNGKGKGKGKSKNGKDGKSSSSGGSCRSSGRTPRIVRTSSGRASRETYRMSHSHEIEALTGEKERKPPSKPEKFVLCEECHVKHAALPPALQHPAKSGQAPHPLTEQALEKTMESTVDVDQELSSEIFNEREDLLTLCQTNHYQFDQVRRAKHSTMMFLYHIFNPESMREALPATCDECKKPINGAQYRCKTCPDYDMCMNCNKRRVVHQVDGKVHELRLHDPSSEPNVFVERRMEQQRLQNRRRLNEILIHATTCELGKTWPNACRHGKSCFKFGEFLRHWVACPNKSNRKTCNQCTILTPIMQHHYKVCNDKKCLVPQCRAHQTLFQRNVQRQGNVTLASRGSSSGSSSATPASPSAAKENNSRPAGAAAARSSSKSSTTLVLNSAKKRKHSAAPPSKNKFARNSVKV